MRPALALLALTLLLAAPLASAQQTGALILRFDPPLTPLHAGDRIRVEGTATFIADDTAYASITGVPVTYAIKAVDPSLAAIVTPSTDVFPLPTPPMPGTAITVVRPVVVDIAVSEALAAGHHAAMVVVEGVTTPSIAAHSALGRADVPLMLEGAPLCAAGAVTTQAFDARPVPVPVAGDAVLGALAFLAGAGVVLALRRPRALLPLGALLLGGLLAPPASAQQAGQLLLTTMPPANAMSSGNVTAIPITAVLTVDDTGMANIIGTPVTYTVTKAPAWLGVSLSPAIDVLPVPSTPPPGASYTVAKPFVATLLVGDLNFTGTRVDTVEITGTTLAANGGHSFVGRVSFPVAATGVPCAQTAQPAQTTAAPSLQPAPSVPPSKDPGLTVQSTQARVPVSSYALVAGFAVAGAGVGLLLRRRAQAR